MLAFPARRDGRLLYVDRAGSVVRQTEAKATLHVANHRGQVEIDVLTPALDDRRWGFLGPSGRFLGTSRYDGASPFHEGRAFVGERAGVGAKGVPVLHWRVIAEDLAPRGTETLAQFHPVSGGVAPACVVRSEDPLDVYGGARRWGLLGPDGAWCAAPRWDWLGAFSEGRAAADLDRKCGFIDARGEWVVEPTYDLVTDFEGGMAQVAIRDARGAASVDEETGRLTLSPAFIGRFGVVDRDGRLLHAVEAPAPVLGLRAGQETREGLSVVQVSGKYGYVDLRGAIVVSPRYDYAIAFSEGRGRVRLGKKEGFVDRTGTEVVAPTLDAALPFSEGRAAAQRTVAVIDRATGKSAKKKRWGFVDLEGSWVIEPRFGPVSSFHDGLALVWLDDERLGYVDRAGDVVWAE